MHLFLAFLFCSVGLFVHFCINILFLLLFVSVITIVFTQAIHSIFFARGSKSTEI